MAGLAVRETDAAGVPGLLGRSRPPGAAADVATAVAALVDHDCVLEPYIGTPSMRAAWQSEDVRSRTASEAVIAMDHRTQEALTTGRVELPRRSVHAGVWFRLQRTLLDELSMPASLWGSRARDLRAAWEQKPSAQSSILERDLRPRRGFRDFVATSEMGRKLSTGFAIQSSSAVSFLGARRR